MTVSKVLKQSGFFALVSFTILLLSACFSTESKQNTGRISAVQPDVLERGQFVWVSVAGENAAFGDTVWLAKGKARIEGEAVERENDSAFRVMFEIPVDAATGDWDLYVSREDGKPPIRLEGGVSIVPPLAWIESLSPRQLDVLGPFVLTIYGHNARFAEDGPVEVRLHSGGDTVDAIKVTLREDKSINAAFELTPDMFAKTWDLQVRTDTRQMAFPGALVVGDGLPEIVSLKPDSVEQFLTSRLTLTGARTRFRQGTAAVRLKRGARTLTMTRIEFNSDTALTVDFDIPQDAELGYWDAELEQPWYRILKRDALKVIPVGPPRVLSITPGSAARGARLDVVVTGHRVQFGQGTQTAIQIILRKGNDSLQTMTARADYMDSKRTTPMTFLVPANADTGLWDVHARYYMPTADYYTPLGITRPPTGNWIDLQPLREGFRITGDNRVDSGKISAVLPDVLERGQFVWVSVAGENAAFGDSVWLAKGEDRIEGEAVERENSSAFRVMFEVPVDAATGEWDLHVSREDGKPPLKLASGISIVPPLAWIESLSPRQLEVLGPFVLTIYGHNARFAEDGPVEVRLHSGGDTVDAEKVTLREDKSINAAFNLTQDMFAKTWDLQIRTDTRQLAFAGALKVGNGLPEIVSLKPDSVEQFLAARVTLTGSRTRFGQGTAVARLKRGDRTLTMTKREYISDTAMTVDFDIPEDAELGFWDVEVEQPWYRILKRDALKVIPVGPPRVLSITPGSAARGARTDVVITGHRVRFSQGTQTHIELTLKNGNDSIQAMTLRTDVGRMDRTSSISISVPANAPTGPWDVHARYYIPEGGIVPPPGVSPSPTRQWIDLQPLREGIRIE